MSSVTATTSRVKTTRRRSAPRTRAEQLHATMTDWLTLRDRIHELLDATDDEFIRPVLDSENMLMRAYDAAEDIAMRIAAEIGLKMTIRD